ncbi:MAG: cytochrome c biogenesis protein ResB [Coriobacteriia bacterium]|nr:cytochrome c biogenesis protein ResB [Coriobacteriia bacterium]
MRTFLDSLLRLLRSRRLAVVLIAFLGVFSIAATFVPRGTPDDPAVRAWALANPVLEAVVGPLGLHRAYASPLFLAFAALLAVCTTACALERTRRALTLARGMRELSSNLEERLRDRPQSRNALPSDIDAQAALDETAAGLQRLGLRIRRGPGLVEGISGAWGVFGSPVFHWSIVALMLVAAAGQATRAEGFMGLPVGERVADVRANYLQITEGPLFGERFTGVEFQSEDIVRNFTLGNVDYGPSPIVIAFRDGTQVATGRVYPNSPLRVGSLLVHMADFGPAATLALESAGGAEVGRHTVMLDRSTETSSGTGPREFSFVGGTDVLPIDARVQVVVIRTPAGATPAPQVSRAVVETSTAGSGVYGPPVTLAVGEFLTLPGGARLRLADVKDWARVSVTNDWSVDLLYVLFGIAIAGLSVAVLVPARRASVLLVENTVGWSLHVATWHSRRDPLLSARVAQVVRDAAGVQEDS